MIEITLPADDGRLEPYRLEGRPLVPTKPPAKFNRIALAAAHAIEISSGSFVKFVDVGNQASPQQVYFGTEYQSQDLSRYAIPVEVLCGFFFIVIALAFVGPGQELGRALKRWPNRVLTENCGLYRLPTGLA